MSILIRCTLIATTVCAVVGATVGAQRAPEPVEVAFIANAEGAEVALVDVAARSLIGTIAVNFADVEAEGPGAPNYAQDTDVSPDGRTLYVSRGYLGDVAAFEIASGRPLWTRPLNTMRADHMTLTRDGRELFVSAFVDNRVYRLPPDGDITGHFTSGIFPHDVKVSKDGRRLFNTSLGQMPSFVVPAGSRPVLEKPEVPVQLTIADAGTLAIRDRIPLDVAMRPWHFNANETGIYAELSNQHAVVFYDLAARKVTRRLDLPMKAGITVKDWDFEAPFHGLALTDDGATLCLAGRASDYAALVRASDLTLIATVPVGDGPGWAETADNGRVCLIANTRSDDLSFVSIADRKEVLRLPIGNGPKHITVARVPASVVAEVKARQEPKPGPAPEGFVQVPGGKVFYKIMGAGERTPLLLLHGGPGGRSCGFSVLADLATDRRVIRYDQLGSGQSDRPTDLSLWRTERFVEELDAVRNALGLREVHILGHSWGGTLATEYLLTKGQQGVKSVILSSPLISTPRWLADARRLRSTLPKSVQSALSKCEAVDTADDPSCVAANDVFEEHFVRGAKSLPAVAECEGITGGDAVYRHMWGAAEFTATGVLRDYDRSNRLGELKLPVLFLAGRHDEAVPETIADFQRRVPGAKMIVLENSAHSTYRTETAEYVKIVRQFLDEAERRR